MAKALGQAIEAMKQGNPEVTRLFAARELPGDPLDTLITLAAKVLEAEVTSELKAQLLQPCRELLRRLNDSGPLTHGRLGFLQGCLCGALPVRVSEVAEHMGRQDENVGGIEELIAAHVHPPNRRVVSGRQPTRWPVAVNVSIRTFVLFVKN